MAETKKTPIMLDNVEYIYEDMTPKQQVLVNHLADLDRKIGASQFNLDQLGFGKQKAIELLKAELEAVVEEPKAE